MTVGELGAPQPLGGSVLLLGEARPLRDLGCWGDVGLRGPSPTGTCEGTAGLRLCRLRVFMVGRRTLFPPPRRAGFPQWGVRAVPSAAGAHGSPE